MISSTSKNIELTSKNLKEDNLKNQNENNIYSNSKDTNTFNMRSSMVSF